MREGVVLPVVSVPLDHSVKEWTAFVLPWWWQFLTATFKCVVRNSPIRLITVTSVNPLVDFIEANFEIHGNCMFSMFYMWPELRKGRPYPAFSFDFWQYLNPHIFTTIHGSNRILGTVQVLTFTQCHPTLEVWSSLHSTDMHLCSSAIFRRICRNCKCLELCPVLPWLCSPKTSFLRHWCSNFFCIKHLHLI